MDSEKVLCITLPLAAVSIVAILFFTGVQCSQQTADAFNKCVAATQKPLECKNAVPR